MSRRVKTSTIRYDSHGGCYFWMQESLNLEEWPYVAGWCYRHIDPRVWLGVAPA